MELFKKQTDHSKIDKLILQKMIYSLHLVEQLRINGLDFIFRGGTCLVLLLEEGNRFSIDIDIICKVGKVELEGVLNRVIESSRFTEWVLDERRSYRSGVPKAHYKFRFDTHRHGSGTILLDVLIENPVYPQLIEVPITTKWIETEDKANVTVPSIDSIIGDKLSAFAPNTIGIPYFKGADHQPFSMEICKQLYDLSKLFEKIDNMEIIAASFRAFATQEIAYRKIRYPDQELTVDAVLHDTIATCLTIARRGAGSDDERMKYAELQRGIRAFGTGYLMSGHFRIDDAIPAAARIAYLAAKILMNSLNPVEYFDSRNVKDVIINIPEMTFLNRLKRQPDKSSFYYWFKTVELLSQGKQPAM